MARITSHDMIVTAQTGYYPAVAPSVGRIHSYVLKNMSPAVEETPNADGSICNTVNKEEVVEHDFPPGSVPPEI
ncbi:hypothetical protein Tco_0825608, partial [Tanacetum coccineum]